MISNICTHYHRNLDQTEPKKKLFFQHPYDLGPLSCLRSGPTISFFEWCEYNVACPPEEEEK